MKIIIWGFPLHTHTHSYIHYGWVKGFTYLAEKNPELGIESVHWFHDKDFPKNFDYNNCLFITEGYADDNIPIVKSSTYFVHTCIKPERYLSVGCRLIDIRYYAKQITDHNYWYKFNKESCERISDYTYYERVHDNSGVVKHKDSPTKMDYEVIYTCWATDLLPEEFNFDDVYKERKNVINWVGSISAANEREVGKFKEVCRQNNISFSHSDPWRHPISFEENKRLVQESFIAPDLRGSGDLNRMRIGDTGTDQLSSGYIPCRVLKNISYGQLGLTNSSAVKELLGEFVLFDLDTNNLFRMGKEHMKDYDYMKRCMKHVQENHTYVNRVRDVFEVFNKFKS